MRAVIAYLSAFLTDQQHLARLPSKVNGDEVTVSGLRILVLPVSTSRRPRGILAKIDMADGVTVMPTELPSDKEMAITIAHALMVSAQTGKEMDKALEIARWLDPNADQEWIQRNFDSKSGVETVQQQKERRSDAGFYYMLDPPQPTTSVPSEGASPTTSIQRETIGSPAKSSKRCVCVRTKRVTGLIAIESSESAHRT